MKTNLPNWKRLSTAAFLVVSTTAFAVTPVLVSPVWGQVPPIPGLSPRDRAGYPVWLDGYKLFHIAAPQVENASDPQDFLSPAERARKIETNLYKILEKGFAPETLDVTSRLVNGLPVIYVEDGKTLEPQSLMTVTQLDAELGAGDAETRAAELADIIESALIRAARERQPQQLRQHGFLAGGVMLAALVLSWSMGRLQQKVKAQRRNLSAINTTDTNPITGEVSPAIALPGEVQTLAKVQQRMNRRQQLNLNEIQLRLLQVGKVGILVSAVVLNLGLFPYTRWLQSLILLARLEVLGVILITYVAVRFVAVLIDRFFGALSEGELIDSRASKRLALRISTFSRVLKSISTITGITISALVILTILGVDIVPLLAGAGVFALSISFASQHAIRDVINGLLILFEDQYAVGDVIVVGNLGGLVESMNLRITQLRNDEGRLISIPNGSIAVVENLSKEWSRVDFAIDIAYESDLEQALAIIQEVAQQLYCDRNWRKRLIEPPEILGVDEIDHAGILIRVWFKTQPLEQWNVAREFRRRLKPELDRNNIHIGTPQQSFWFRNSETEPNGNGGQGSRGAGEHQGQGS